MSNDLGRVENTRGAKKVFKGMPSFKLLGWLTEKCSNGHSRKFISY